MLFFKTQRRPDLAKPDVPLVDRKASIEPTWCTNSAPRGALSRDSVQRFWGEWHWSEIWPLVVFEPVWTWVDPRLSSRQRGWCGNASAFNNALRNPWISIGISNLFWVSSVYSLPNHKGIYLAQMSSSTACAVFRKELPQSKQEEN